MAKDDYFVIAYIILAYMYDCLKKGKNIDINEINCSKLEISQNYLEYIYLHLYKDGYIENCLYNVNAIRGEEIEINSRTKITPKGIEYLQDNSKMDKAKSVILQSKEIIEAIPIIGKILY